MALGTHAPRITPGRHDVLQEDKWCNRSWYSTVINEKNNVFQQIINKKLVRENMFTNGLVIQMERPRCLSYGTTAVYTDNKGQSWYKPEIINNIHDKTTGLQSSIVYHLPAPKLCYTDTIVCSSH